MPPVEEVVLGRLDRMEQKLDKVSDAITTLARVEERQTQQREVIGRVWVSIEKLEKRLADIEKGVNKNTTVLGLGAKFWWPFYGAVIALLVVYFRGAFGIA